MIEAHVTCDHDCHLPVADVSTAHQVVRMVERHVAVSGHQVMIVIRPTDDPTEDPGDLS